MKMTKLAMTALLTGAICGGCARDKSEPESEPIAVSTPKRSTASPTTKPVATPTVTTSTPTAASAAVPDKDMTHVLTKDEAYYATSPAQATKPDGTLKGGTKVVLLMPRGSYAQVMTADGKRVYTSTAGLSPVGK